MPMLLVGCRDDGGDPEGAPGLAISADAAIPPPAISPSPGPSAEAGPLPTPVDAGVDLAPPPPAACTAVPIAYVLDSADQTTHFDGGAAALLGQAGFEVRALPLDADPSTLAGLIFLASFSSQNPTFHDYLVRNGPELDRFVRAGNVLVQMAQTDDSEAAPSFLPLSRVARRQRTNAGRLFLLDRTNPLLAGVPVGADGALVWRFPQLAWNTFASQGGFEVVLAGTGDAQNPGLMEGSSGAGRVVLSAIPADKPLGLGPDRDTFNHAFFANLFRHVSAVCHHTVPLPFVTPSPLETPFTTGSSMVAVLPDTQYYSHFYPGIYDAQTSWIATHARERKIAYVFHLGDIVDTNTAVEWERAASSMRLLQGLVPYALAPGNHDYGVDGDSASRATLLDQYFSYTETAQLPSFGGAFQPGQLENTYHLFSTGGRDYLLLALEWAPRDEVVAWADAVMTAHPDRYGILITHAYLNDDGLRYDINDKVHPQEYNPHTYATPGFINDGEQLWQKLVRKHPFVMTLNGHVLGSGTGYLASITDKGNTCHQMLSNYQFRSLGGEGYMRLLEFLPDGSTVRVFTYSPLYDNFLLGADQAFTFTLDVPPQHPPG